MNRIFFITILFFSITHSFSQSKKINAGSKVLSDDSGDSTSEILINKIDPLKKSYGENYSKFKDKFNRVDFGKGQRTEQQYLEYLQSNFQELKSFETMSNLMVKCEEIDRLQKSINNYTYTSCTHINQINNLKNRIDKQIDVVKKVKSKKAIISDINKKSNDKLAQFNKEIEKEKAQLTNEKNKVDTYTKNNKVKSLDDFLSESNIEKSGSGDFLEVEENTNQDDFLATENSDALNDTKKGFKIVNDGSLSGVIDNTGNILIPFKNWQIQAYKNGIAKVSILIDNNFTCNNITYSASKKGFVDKSGDFIDEVIIDFSEYEYGRSDIFLVSIPKFNSVEEQQAYERRIKARKREKEREKALETARCKNDVTLWKNNIIEKQ
jgi:hypothetical protein